MKSDHSHAPGATRRALPRLALPIFLLPLLLALGSALPASAQSSAYLYTAPVASITEGGNITVDFTLDSSNAGPIARYSIAVCHDPALFSIVDFEPGPGIVAINGGFPPFIINPLSDLDGWGMFVDLDNPWVVGETTIPPSPHTVLARVTYAAIGTPGETSALEFCEVSVFPNLANNVVVYPGGGGETPTTIDGSLTIQGISARIDDAGIGFPGSSVETSVRLSSPVGLRGFQFGISSDPRVTITGATPIGVLAATNGGSGPESFIVDLTPSGGDGVTIACSVSTSAPFEEIPAGFEQPVVSLACSIDPAAGPECTFAALSLDPSLGLPSQATTPTFAAPLETNDGEIEIGAAPPAPPSGGVTLLATSAVVAAGTSVTTQVFLDSDVPVSAFSFGLEHDATDVTLVGVSMGSALAALRCGSGPDTFFTTMIPGTPSGVAVASIFALSPPFDGSLLPAGSGHELVVVEYDIATTPAVGGSTLTFTDTLGSPEAFAIEVTGNGVAQAVTTVGGSIIAGSGAGTFIRGECNAGSGTDLSDAIFLLSYLFPSGAPPAIPCADACDANDDGALNLADAIRILGFLFSGGAPFPGPLGACGVDSTPDALDCVFAASCP